MLYIEHRRLPHEYDLTTRFQFLLGNGTNTMQQKMCISLFMHYSKVGKHVQVCLIYSFTYMHVNFQHTIIDWLIAAGTITFKQKTMWVLCEHGY